MGLFKNLFGQKNTAITSYPDFWAWFKNHEKDFFNVVKNRGAIEQEFFNKLSPKLAELKTGFYFLTGMYNDSIVELIFTADGSVKNMVFVEEIVNAAPNIPGWKFTALKPALDITNVGIKMGGYEFKSENLSFCANEVAGYADEIDITVFYQPFKPEDQGTITNGIYVFLDNYLGELEFATTIDNLQIGNPEHAEGELVPITKLKDFLNWRQKEFVEKYEGILHSTEDDTYASLEAILSNGNPLIAIVNTDILSWESKASHPWILDVEIKYGNSSNNGMPDDKMYQLLNVIEDEITSELKDADGYLNIGRETADGLRTIYFACKDFRKPSRTLHNIQKKYASNLQVDYNIYKDKYWQTFNKYIN